MKNWKKPITIARHAYGDVYKNTEFYIEKPGDAYLVFKGCLLYTSRTKAARAKGLYNADNTMIIKKSDENPLVIELYEGLLKGKEHELLHNDAY